MLSLLMVKWLVVLLSLLLGATSTNTSLTTMVLGMGEVSSPQTQRGYTAFVHTKVSQVIGASGIHVGTISFGKMEGDASDHGIAVMLQEEEADGP